MSSVHDESKLITPDAEEKRIAEATRLNEGLGRTTNKSSFNRREVLKRYLFCLTVVPSNLILKITRTNKKCHIPKLAPKILFVLVFCLHFLPPANAFQETFLIIMDSIVARIFIKCLLQF